MCPRPFPPSTRFWHSLLLSANLLRVPCGPASRALWRYEHGMGQPLLPPGHCSPLQPSSLGCRQGDPWKPRGLHKALLSSDCRISTSRTYRFLSLREPQPQNERCQLPAIGNPGLHAGFFWCLLSLTRDGGNTSFLTPGAGEQIRMGPFLSILFKEISFPMNLQASLAWVGGGSLIT